MLLHNNQNVRDLFGQNGCVLKPENVNRFEKVTYLTSVFCFFVPCEVSRLT